MATTADGVHHDSVRPGPILSGTGRRRTATRRSSRRATADPSGARPIRSRGISSQASPTDPRVGPGPSPIVSKRQGGVADFFTTRAVDPTSRVGCVESAKTHHTPGKRPPPTSTDTPGQTERHRSLDAPTRLPGRLFVPRALRADGRPHHRRSTLGGSAAKCSGRSRGSTAPLVDERGYQRGPAGLMRGPQAGTVVAMEVFVEEDHVAPERVILELP